MPGRLGDESFYLATIRRIPLLGPEEEQQLARRWRDAGDRDAFEQLVRANLRFVVHVANRYRFAGQFMDLVQEGNAGLVRAVHKFDPDRHVRLVSYAGWWIRAYIHEYLLRTHSMVRVATTDTERRLFFSLGRARQAVEAEGLGQEDRVRVLADRCGAEEDDVSRMEVRLGGDVSLSAESGWMPLEDALADAAPGPEGALASRETRRLVARRVSGLAPSLSERERYVVERRILAEEPEGLREIGTRFGVTRERVRQIEVRVYQKLKERLMDVPASP